MFPNGKYDFQHMELFPKSNFDFLQTYIFYKTATSSLTGMSIMEKIIHSTGYYFQVESRFGATFGWTSAPNKHQTEYPIACVKANGRIKKPIIELIMMKHTNRIRKQVFNQDKLAVSKNCYSTVTAFTNCPPPICCNAPFAWISISWSGNRQTIFGEQRSRLEHNTTDWERAKYYNRTTGNLGYTHNMEIHTLWNCFGQFYHSAASGMHIRATSCHK